MRALRLFFQSFFLLLSRLFMKVRVHGTEHLKNVTGPVIFMPNHTSYIDPLVLIAALPWRIRWRLAFAAANDMLYETFSWAAIPGEFLMHAFPFPRHETENIQQGLDAVGRLLDKKVSVVLFPEGMISQTGDLLPLKRGAGLLAIEMGVTIIPVNIIGSQTICPYDSLVPRSRGTVDIVFGEPLMFSRKESYVQATERITDALKNCKP